MPSLGPIDKIRENLRHLRLRHFWLQFAVTVFQRYGQDNGAMLSAGLAFYMMIAFVPMLLTGIGALGFYFQITHNSGNAVDDIRNLLTTQILPGAAGQEVQHLMDRIDVPGKIKQITDTRGMSGLIGVLGMIWASIQIYLNGMVAMNAAFQATENRNWARLRLLAFGLFLVTGVFLVLSIVSTAYGTLLANSALGKVVPYWAVMVETGAEIAAIVGASVMFALTYRYLPAMRVSWRSAFAGGITSGVLWEVAKKGLAVYLLHPNFTIYGNLANLIIFLIWVYYSMTIFVLGGEVSAAYAVEVEGRHRTAMARTRDVEPASEATAP